MKSKFHVQPTLGGRGLHKNVSTWRCERLKPLLKLATTLFLLVFS